MAVSSVSWGQWNLVMNAYETPSGCLQLTNAAVDQRGAAWAECPMNLEAPFDLSFTINAGTMNGGGDGMCFVLHKAGNAGPGVIGTTGGALGYENGPFTPSLMVEFDTYQNTDVGDPVADHIGISSNGSISHNLSAPVQAHPTLTNIENGNDFDARLTWDPALQELKVFFEGSLRKTLSIDLVDGLFGGDGLVDWGFTASTGGAVNAHRVCPGELLYASYLDPLAFEPAGPWEFCEGETLTVTVDSDSDALEATWQASGSASLTIASPGQYFAVAQDANGCAVVDAIDVVQAPSPGLTLLVDPSVVVCGGESALLEAAAEPEAIVSWEGNGPGGQLEVASSGSYSVVAQLGACEQSETVEVLLQPIPELTFAAEGQPLLDDVVELCDGDFVALEVLATEDAEATWVANGNDVLVTGNGGAFVASAIVNGCESPQEAVEVVLLPLPEAQVSAAPEVLCWGTLGTVQAEFSEAVDSYEWSLPSGTSALNQAGPGLYQLSLQGMNGCQNEYVLSLGMLPPIATGLEDPEPLCSDGVAVLEVTEQVDGLAWNTGGSDATLQVVNSMGGGPFVATVTLGSCTETDTAFVEWWPEPSADALPSNASACALDLPFVLEWPAQAQDAVGSWQWTVNGEGTNAVGHGLSQEGTYTIEVRDNATGCFDTQSVALNVLPNLFLDAFVVDPLICRGDSTEIVVEVFTLEGLDAFELPVFFEWDAPLVQGYQPTVAGGEYTATAQNGCGTSRVEVVVEEEYCGCDVYVPNAFTPDGDGLNEGFKVHTACEFDTFEFEVFNRWGQVVWRSNDASEPWDGGVNVNGIGDHYLPDGVYPYTVAWSYSDDGQQIRESRIGRILIVR